MQTVFLTNEQSLIAAFDPPRGVTALIGGGGKTTLMLLLTRELAKRGARVIVTTTTHIFPPDGIPTLNPATLAEAQEALDRNPLICLGKPAEHGKLAAPDLTISSMTQIADYVLVEADGAKQLPLKAPAAHEPVIPPETKLVVAVAGLDGVGRPIKEITFRPERYAALCGKREQDAVTEQDVAIALTHPQGQRKGVSADMRFAVLLNKADDAARINSARAIATSLEQVLVERVVIAALQDRSTQG